MKEQDLIWFRLPPPPTAVPEPPEAPPRPVVTVEIDGAAVEVPQGATLLDACRAAGKDIPTLCYLETLTPVNACRVCVVEVEGARVLACLRDSKCPRFTPVSSLRGCSRSVTSRGSMGCRGWDADARLSP